MNDILPEQTPAWRYLERTVAELLDGYGYSEIRLPILEFTELFARGIGEGTDVVDKEMYTFLDRNEESLTLRPEGTAGCVRAVLEHGLSGGGQVQKLWYTGPMFRYEKPQKGRYREFTQFGVEMLGKPDKDEVVSLLKICLDSFAVDYRFVPSVKRGLSYYVEDGFEAECERLGAQKQVAGGGRYAEGIGWAIGVDRLSLASAKGTK